MNCNFKKEYRFHRGYSFTCVFLLVLLGFAPMLTVPLGKEKYSIFHGFEGMQSVINQQSILLAKETLKKLSMCLDLMEASAIFIGAVLFLLLVTNGFVKEKLVKMGSICLISAYILLGIMVVILNICWNQAIKKELNIYSVLAEGAITLNSFYYWQILGVILLFFLSDKGKKIKKTTGFWWLIGYPAVLGIGKILFNSRSYYLMAVCLVFLAMIPFVRRWEQGMGKRGREMVIIATLTAIASISRGMFYMLPQVKPVAAIVIITGATLGPNAGFMTGALSALMSNFLFGQGPWTPWQMFAFGMLGLLSGLLFSKHDIRQKSRRIGISLFGGFFVFVVYGLIMDTASVFMFTNNISWKLLLSTYITGIPFNIIHGVGTTLFLLVLTGPISKKIYRIKRKYGVFS